MFMMIYFRCSMLLMNHKARGIDVLGRNLYSGVGGHNSYARTSVQKGLAVGLKSVATFESLYNTNRSEERMWEAMQPLMTVAGHETFEAPLINDTNFLERRYWDSIRCGQADYAEMLKPYFVNRDGRTLNEAPYLWGFRKTGTKVTERPTSSTSPFGKVTTSCFKFMPVFHAPPPASAPAHL
jgi:hypothetical protein